MPKCKAPTCDRTRAKKGQKGKCVRPNPWNVYRKQLKGRGFSQDLIREMYGMWSADWRLENPDLSRSDARTRMNETLCEDIEEYRLSTQFFTKKKVPPGWSLEAEIKKLSAQARLSNPGVPLPLASWFKFSHTPRKSTRKKTEVMYGKSILSMRPGKWYTDEVINTYMILLSGEGNPGSKKSRFMSSYLYDKFKAELTPDLANASPKMRHDLVKNFTRKQNTTGAVKIFVPVNVSIGGRDKDHWIMIMIDVKNKAVVSMDSLKNRLNVGPRQVMMDWIEQEHRSKRRKFNRDEWSNYPMKSLAHQSNGYDCGPFALMYAAYMSNDKLPKFMQGDVKTKMRERIAWCILNCKLN